MNKIKIITLLLLFAISSIPVIGQAAERLKRTTFKTDKFDFGPGGTLAIIGAPSGSIRVEGWEKGQIEISAEISLEADSEADLNLLSEITGFVLTEELGRAGIASVGINDKKYLKQIKRKLPKNLAGMPYRIDYVVRAPHFSDLQIDGGSGKLHITGIDGTMRVNFLESDARINLVGGSLLATFGSGNVEVTIPTRSWRGRFVDVQLAKGELSAALPPGLNATLDASILQTGSIENSFSELVPRIRKAEFTDKSIAAKAGAGTVPIRFVVTDGILRLTTYR